jgi:hypothetical protein
MPHRLKVILCPIHQEEQAFSPRLLPAQSGYRILSLDAGGVAGIAQLAMLKHIERRCFEIPSIHLFDLVLGTGVGGQIALALNTRTQYGFLSVSTATAKFQELIPTVFDSKFWAPVVPSLLMNAVNYKTATLERHL